MRGKEMTNLQDYRRRKSDRAPSARVPEHVQVCLAAVVIEALDLRKSLSAIAFDRDPHAQLLVGYVKGTAFGLGMDHHELVDVIRPLVREGNPDSLWRLPS